MHRVFLFTQQWIYQSISPGSQLDSMWTFLVCGDTHITNNCQCVRSTNNPNFYWESTEIRAFLRFRSDFMAGPWTSGVSFETHSNRIPSYLPIHCYVNEVNPRYSHPGILDTATLKWEKDTVTSLAKIPRYLLSKWVTNGCLLPLTYQV